MDVNSIRTGLINAVDQVDTVVVQTYCQQIKTQTQNIKDSILRELDNNGSTVLTLAQRKANDNTNLQINDSKKILEFLNVLA